MRITPIVDTHRHAMWAYTVPTLGAFLICTAMCGSGRRTGTQHTVREHRPTLRVQLRAPTVSLGAAPGARYGRSCVRLRAYSASPSHRNSPIGFRVGFQIQPDEASPELELFGGADIPHKRDEPWAEPGYGASDVRDGNLTSSVTQSGTVDVNTTGTYTLTYTVSDAAGNEANATRTVRVVDHFAELNSTVTLEMIWVEPGTFTMGQTGVTNSEPEHNVTLTQGFYLGKYEVTQAQYEAVMTGNTDGLSATPSQLAGNPDRPVEKVSWDDIQKFLTRLNAQEAGNIPAGWAYVLPTEAQWEYACRAGTTTAYSWGDAITSDDATTIGMVTGIRSDFKETRDVGSVQCQPMGLF